mmetsp:Transcript_11812/g.38804  ORF Transcript_11812/g.38804 Transcript_11812/m.38804 type:complete len:116 (+) Transcript_11812:1611-1958(+)
MAPNKGKDCTCGLGPSAHFAELPRELHASADCVRSAIPAVTTTVVLGDGAAREGMAAHLAHGVYRSTRGVFTRRARAKASGVTQGSSRYSASGGGALLEQGARRSGWKPFAPLIC